jgi:D-proline reductase (dithiol) PrdB
VVRLADLPEYQRKHIANAPCPTYDTAPFVPPRPLNKRRLAIISTAGLQHLGEKPFPFGAMSYRVILRGDERPIVSSHTSTNFDRAGMQEDLNVVFPLDRLDEMAVEGVLGSVADFHYSFMGATPPEMLEKNARKLAPLLKDDGVDTVLLVPV